MAVYLSKMAATMVEPNFILTGIKMQARTQGGANPSWASYFKIMQCFTRN